MLPFRVYRRLFRIPLVRENAEAIHSLNNTFYLLLAMYRENRLQEFNELKYLYFRMIDSFAQYGRSEAKETIDELMAIPWFRDHRSDVYRLIAAFDRILTSMRVEGEERMQHASIENTNRAIAVFVEAFKVLVNFDSKDEARVASLQADPEFIDELLLKMRPLLGARTSTARKPLAQTHGLSSRNTTQAQQI